MRVVVALGGNALLEREERPDAVIQRRHVGQAAAALAPLAGDHQLVLCHGNGPQVGMLALESQADTSLSRPYPLDVLVAETRGMIGYWLVQELGNAGVAQRAVCVISQTVVAPADPAFGHPAKFIGASYDHSDAQALAARLGWTIAADGPRWRRVVASPRPRGLVEIETVRALADAGVLVVCGGGGGRPGAPAGAGGPAAGGARGGQRPAPGRRAGAASAAGGGGRPGCGRDHRLPGGECGRDAGGGGRLGAGHQRG